MQRIRIVLGRRRMSLLALGLGLLMASAIATTATAAGSAPVIARLSLSHITEREATLEGVINPEGSETTYEFWLSWQSPCGHHRACKAPLNTEVVGTGNLVAGDEAQTVSMHLTDLTVHDYRYWIVATNSNGKTQRGEQSFKTKRTKKNVARAAAGGAPVVVSQSVSHITESEATLEARINPNGSETTYELWLEAECHCRKHPPFHPKLVSTGTIPAGEDHTVSARVSELFGGKLDFYVFWVVATNSSGKTDTQRHHHTRFKVLKKKK